MTPDSIRRIKEAVSLPTLVEDYGIVLRRTSADQWFGKCPFHKEKTGSFGVHAAYFKCFGCGVSGDAITFVARFEGVSTGKAMAILSERTGVALDGPKLTRREVAYAKREAAFCQWWYRRTVDQMNTRISEMLADEATPSEELYRVGKVLWALRSLSQDQLRGVVFDVATADDRREYAEKLRFDAEFQRLWLGLEGRIAA